jgi:hypothetical protein
METKIRTIDQLVHRTAQQIIASLPAKCYGVNNATNGLIIIKAGKTGYYPVSDYQWMMDNHECTTPSQLADQLNDSDGVTKAQRAAMEWGSMFGYAVPLSDPENYDEHGAPYCTSNPRPTN